MPFGLFRTLTPATILRAYQCIGRFARQGAIMLKPAHGEFTLTAPWGKRMLAKPSDVIS